MNREDRELYIIGYQHSRSHAVKLVQALLCLYSRHAELLVDSSCSVTAMIHQRKERKLSNQQIQLVKQVLEDHGFSVEMR